MLDIIFIVIFLLGIIRYSAYQYLTRYKQANNFITPNYDFDLTYHETLAEPSNDDLFYNYENVNIEPFTDAYNVIIIRKYLWSHNTDSTIELSGMVDGYSVLDMGCGTGNIAIHMAKMFPQLSIHCIVNSKKLYQCVDSKIISNKLQNQIKVYLMDFDNLTEPITGLKFDRILFLESIGYSINRRKLLENCRKLLKTDGKLFIRTPTFCDVATPQDYQHNNYLIKTWKYNFSTLNCIINDLYREKYIQIQYIAFNKMLCNFFINPSDIYNTYQFNKINNLDLINLDVYLTPSTSVMSIIIAS